MSKAVSSIPELAQSEPLPIPLPPVSDRIRNDFIDFELQGITNALRFEYYCRLAPESFSWLSVDVIWQGEKWDGLGAFFGAEIKTDKGWISLRQPDESRVYWRTREDLWIELCFEAFLKWFVGELAANRWLRLYTYPQQSGFFLLSGANLCGDEEDCQALTHLEQSQITDGLINEADARYFSVPLFR